MDIAVSKKKVPHLPRYLILALVVVLVAASLRYLLYLGQAEFSIDRDTLVVDQVKRGEFTVSVRGAGVLVPDNIQWLAADVEATVVRVVVKAGKVVETGDPIVELSNPQLAQQLAEAEWELEAMEAEATTAKVAQESDLLEQKAALLNAKLDYESRLLQYNAETELLETDAVSKLAYQRTRLETDQLKQRWQISQEQYTKMQENLSAQNRARTSRLNIARKRLERIEQQVNDLVVKASMDSIVLEMPLESGQRLVPGANIAKLAQQDSLIAELRVPEIQIRDVTAEQRVIVDTRNSKVEGKVLRVDPAVVNGSVQVDVAFPQGLPDDARPDLSVDGEIKITEIEDALYVDRPLFSQSKSRTAFYRLTEDGKFAERVDVVLGYGSVNQIQALEGLSAGDTIITSDTSRFEGYDKIRINN